MNIKIKNRLFLSILLCALVVVPIGSILATQSSDSFDSNPYGGSWVNELGSAVWDSTNGELDISNDNDIAIRYTPSTGSIEHEAQVTALMVTGERLVGPGVRFDNSGENSMYGMVVEGPMINIFRYNLGVRTTIGSIASGVSSVAGNYYTMRMSATGTNGNSVVLNFWVQNHGSTKPSDPGWIGNDGSPNVTFTDSSASGTRLDGVQNTGTGIAGRASVNLNDNRHDYFKSRAISDRGGATPPPVTPPTPPSDTTPPTVSSISVSNVSTTGATISWTTNESATSQLQYGLTTSYGSTVSSGGTTSHTVNLSNLTPNTTYNYRVSATDTSNNNTLSSNQTFTTSQVVVTPPEPTTPPVTPPPTIPSGTPTPTGTGKYLYVSPTGNDSVTYANNNASNPWRTIGRATWGSTNRDARNGAEAAKAGDVVLVSAGTYTGVGTGSRNEILYYQENSGTAGNPITFKANGTVVLTQSGIGAMIGAYNRNYITWDGFTIDEANARSAPDTGPTTVYGCNGCVLQNLILIGNGTDFGRMDNHTGIRIEGSTNISVRNNRISNFYTSHNVNNGACIQTYSSYGLIIENNELFNCGSGIFLKGGPWSSYPTVSSYIRNNYIHDIGENGRGGSAIIAHAGAPYTTSNPIYIYRNVIRNAMEAGLRIWPFSPTDPMNNPQNIKFINNTIDNVGPGLHISSPLTINTGNAFWNNIVVNSDHGVAYNDVSSNVIPSRVDFEHNLYFSNTTLAEIGNGTTYTLATWKSTYNHDLSTPASISSNPLFISSTDYRLQSNSPARTLGVDILDLDGDGSTTDIVPAGAYVTGNEIIGVGGTASSNPPPPPPPSDTTPPTVSSISVSNITTTGATVSWTTNESATSQLQYGPTTSYGSTANSGGGTSHSVTLSNLTSNTTYNFRVSATDSAGNNTLSTNQTFTTSQVVVTPPVSTKFTIGQRVQTSANVNVRATANSSGTLLGTQNSGSLGTVVGGPTNANNINWWNINYDSGADGWSAEDFVQVYSSPSTPTIPSGTPTPTGTGKYLYVSPTGNDSVTYANNNASNPWRTIGRASWGSTNRSSPNANEAARAGDVVLIIGGSYDSTEVVNNRFSVVYNPVNSGSSGNYITFACVGDCTLSASSANGPVIGSTGRNYIKWFADVSQGNSWIINACGMQSGCSTGTVNTSPDTGPVVCHDGTGCYIEGAVIDGTTPVDYTDNWNGIRVENAPSAVIRNNTIRNFRTQSGSRNASGITLYGSANTLVENNQISNVAGGIYFKHNSGGSLPMTNVRARYNNISNAGQCVSWSIGVGSNHFYQNICTDSSFGALITGNGLSGDWIFNNTFSNLSGGAMYLSPNGTGGRFWNNICVNCTTAIISEGGPMPAENVIDFEHNVYRGYNNFYSGVGGSQTFATFKSTYPAFEQSAPASIDADPMFVSSTNFRLQSNSPARTLGVDILDLDGDGSTTDIIPAGAYITGNEVIGLGGTWSSNPPPVTPPVTPPSTPTTPTTPTTPPSTTGGGGGGGAAPAPTTPTTPTNSAPTTNTGGSSTPTTPPSTNTGGAGGVTTPPSTPTTTIPKPTLTRTVYIGSKGTDVTSLQTFLISTGFLSPNLNTGYFGPATRQAVQKYQCTTLQLCSGSESTNGYGVVGAKTRATFSSTSTPTPTTTSTLTTEQRAAIQKQIDALLVLVQQLLVQLQAQKGN